MLRFSNFGKALVTSAPSGTTGLAFTVDPSKATTFPALDTGDYFYGIFKDASGNREIVKVEARSGGSMTIAVGGRGLDGTTPRTWAAGDYFVAGMTNIAMQETLSNVALTALGTLTPAADRLPYFNGSGTASVTALSALMRLFLAAQNEADARWLIKAVGFEGNESIAGNKTFQGITTFTNQVAVNANLVMQSGKLVAFSRSDIPNPSATSANIWQANLVSLSGTVVTFTDFADAPQAGARVTLHCSSAFTFTNNANIAVPGGTYAAKVGDWIEVLALSTTFFQLTIHKINPYAYEGNRGLIGVSSVSDTRNGTNHELAVTPYGLAQSVLGIGQWYQDVTAWRWAGVTYTNDTGKAIVVSVWANTGGVTNQKAEAWVAGTRVAINSLYANGSNYTAHVYFIVPPGHSYAVVLSNVVLSTMIWLELRG